MKIPKPDRLRGFCFFACFVCGLRFSFVIIVRKEDRIGKVFFSHFFAYGEERHRYGVFSAFLCLCKETLAKKTHLPPFPEKGVSPPKGGRHNHEAHLHGYGHRRQSRLSAGKRGHGISLPLWGRWHLRSKWRRGRCAVCKGPAQPRNSLSWVRAPTAKPSECRQDGDAELASPLGGGGICKANAGEGTMSFVRAGTATKLTFVGTGTDGKAV